MMSDYARSERLEIPSRGNKKYGEASNAERAKHHSTCATISALDRITF
jgi:hypothetical protein